LLSLAFRWGARRLRLKILFTDTFDQVWGHDSLFVCDGSIHPINGGFNPVLTIMALAFRNSSCIAASL
jgi:choline dehydrogenase-like flavoprotein